MTLLLMPQGASNLARAWPRVTTTDFEALYAKAVAIWQGNADILAIVII
jgi:hypothetical protein